MIILGSKELKSKKALITRREYVNSLLNESRPNISPSSQEWVSGEYYVGHRNLLLEEIKEIDALLKKMKR